MIWLRVLGLLFLNTINNFCYDVSFVSYFSYCAEWNINYTVLHKTQESIRMGLSLTLESTKRVWNCVFYEVASSYLSMSISLVMGVILILWEKIYELAFKWVIAIFQNFSKFNCSPLETRMLRFVLTIFQISRTNCI